MDAFERAAGKGHAMGDFRSDESGGMVAACRACGLGLFRHANGAIGGAALLVECQTMQAINHQAGQPGRRMASDPG